MASSNSSLLTCKTVARRVGGSPLCVFRCVGLRRSWRADERVSLRGRRLLLRRRLPL